MKHKLHKHIPYVPTLHSSHIDKFIDDNPSPKDLKKLAINNELNSNHVYRIVDALLHHKDNKGVKDILSTYSYGGSLPYEKLKEMKDKLKDSNPEISGLSNDLINRYHPDKTDPSELKKVLVKNKGRPIIFRERHMDNLLPERKTLGSLVPRM